MTWLVEYHLLMSEVAQSPIFRTRKLRRILAISCKPGPAGPVDDPDRLRYPRGGARRLDRLKGSLLRALYYATEPLLSGGHSQLTQKDRIEEAKRALAEKLTGWTAKEIKTYQDRQYSAYWLRADAELQRAHAEMIRTADKVGKPFEGSCISRALRALPNCRFIPPITRGFCR